MGLGMVTWGWRIRFHTHSYGCWQTSVPSWGCWLGTSVLHHVDLSTCHLTVFMTWQLAFPTANGKTAQASIEDRSHSLFITEYLK